MIDNRIKKFRLDSSQTQEDLATAVHVSRQTIVAIEKGNYVPSLALAMELAKHFDTSVENLFTLK